jgi:nicotinamide-nucleotide adenylyltransferase
MIDPVKNDLIAILGRWQPTHRGHQSALQALCSQFNKVIIGIGSSNIQDFRNPFTLSEVEAMLNLSLAGYSNFEFMPVPDVIDDLTWCQNVSQSFGELKYFVSANPYVRSLLAETYSLTHPIEFIPPELRIAVSGTVVRRELARGDDWQSLVPDEVAMFIKDNQLDERFRSQYGLQTLAMETIIV